jgi:hypothetical protein
VNLRRLRAVTRFAMSEVLQLHAWAMAAATIIAVAGMAELVRGFHFGSEQPAFAIELGFAVVRAATTAAASVLPALIVPQAFRNGTPQVWLARGVFRSEWLAAYYASALAVIFLTIVAGTAGVWWTAGRGLGSGFLSAAGGELHANLIRGAIIAAASMLGSCMTRSPLLIMSLAATFVAACELAPLIGRAGRSGGMGIVGRCAPDFSTALDAGDLVFAAAYLALAAAILVRRDL